MFQILFYSKIKKKASRPAAQGAYMLRKFVCVGFHSSQSEVASHHDEPLGTGLFAIPSRFRLVLAKMSVFKVISIFQTIIKSPVQAGMGK